MKPAAKYGIAAAVVIVLLGAAGAFWFLRDDSPDEVNLADAVDSVADETTTTAATDDTGTDNSLPDGDISGTWTVDAETGEFDYESATGTFAGFRIDEELASIGATEAVGRTGDVTGSVVINGTTVESADIEVNMTTITTNESRRDGRVQSALDTEQFPTATFSLTEPIELGEGAATGEQVSVTATGDLTVHGVTKSIQMPLEAQLVNGTVVIVGSTEITFSDFDVEVPSAPVVVSVSDTGTLELQLLLTRG
jgi:polyisoprenoid-binding protein YceI